MGRVIPFDIILFLAYMRKLKDSRSGNIDNDLQYYRADCNKPSFRITAATEISSVEVLVLLQYARIVSHLNPAIKFINFDTCYVL